MYLTIIGLVLDPEVADQQVDAQLLIDGLWAGADLAGPIEHISALTAPRLLEVGLYVRAESQATADRTARDLLELATSTLPLLRGWRIGPPAGGSGP